MAPSHAPLSMETYILRYRAEDSGSSTANLVTDGTVPDRAANARGIGPDSQGFPMEIRFLDPPRLSYF